MRIFFDANILFSAARSDGAIREILTLLDRTEPQCRADASVIDEARRNVLAKAPDAMPVLERLLPRVQTPAVRRVDPALPAPLQRPPKDRPVLVAAMVDACDPLVTGDRSHFGSLYGRTIHGVAIHSPRLLAAALLG